MKQNKQIIKDPKQAKDRKHLLIAIIITETGLIIRTFIIMCLIAVYIIGMALGAILDGFRDMYNYSRDISNYSNVQTSDILTWRKFDESTYEEQCSLIKCAKRNRDNISTDEIEIIKIWKNNDATIPFAPTNNKYDIIVKVKEEYLWITLYTDDTIEETPVDLEYLQKAHIITD